FPEYTDPRNLDFGAFHELQAGVVRGAQCVCFGENRRRPSRGDEPCGFRTAGRAGDGMSRAAFLFAAGILVVALGLAPGSTSQMPSGKEVVAPEAFASHDPVARGMSFEVAVVMKIRPGFHVNAREVTEDYLIPTDLRAELPVGFKIGTISYPKGTLETFSF